MTLLLLVMMITISLLMLVITAAATASAIAATADSHQLLYCHLNVPIGGEEHRQIHVLVKPRAKRGQPLHRLSLMRVAHTSIFCLRGRLWLRVWLQLRMRLRMRLGRRRLPRCCRSVENCSTSGKRLV